MPREAEIPKCALKQRTLTPGAARYLQTPSWRLLHWVFLTWGSKHMQSIYLVNSMGGRVREAIVKGYIKSWKPWEWKGDAHHFQYSHKHIFSRKQHGIPVFSSVPLHAFVFLKAVVPVTGYFQPPGWMPSAMCWVTHAQSSQLNCLNLQP